jgi:LysR family transcriptional regulator, hydrogen peroxide-inducible genes activator
MEMHQVRYFLALCETLNFTRASERCNVAQPSLTRAIKTLEDELGGALFHRERHRTHLTELGQLMRPYLAEILSQSDAAKVKARELAKLESAPLDLGIMCTIGPGNFVDLVRTFQGKNPGVALRLRDGRADQLQELLAAGDLHVAIYALPDAIEDRFHALPLFTERFMIAVAPGHRFERQNAVRVKDLQGEAYLRRASCEFNDHARAIMTEQGVAVNRIYMSERDDWIQSMVVAGLGYGFLPESAATMPGLVLRPLVEPEIKRTICMVTVRGRPHSPSVGAFVRQVTSHKWAHGRQGSPPKAAG